MGLMSADQFTKHVFVKQQLSTDSTKFSSPFYAMVIMHPKNKTVDIHLNCLIEGVTSLNSTFDYFSLNTIMKACGIKRFVGENTTPCGIVTPFGSGAGLTSTMMGRAGLFAGFSNPEQGLFGIGRIFKSSGGNTLGEGLWPMNQTNLIVEGRGYTMDFYDLRYE